MKTKIQDMTSGSPGRLIILFAIPLMLGNICQQLYTMVDTMVVGQVAGVEALAALQYFTSFFKREIASTN